MIVITKETYKNNVAEAIIHDNGILWLNAQYIEIESGHSSLPVVTGRSDPKYRKHTFELVDERKKTTKQNIFMWRFSFKNNNEL